MNESTGAFVTFSAAEVEARFSDLLKRDDAAAELMVTIRGALIDEYLASEPPDMAAVSRYFKALQFGRAAPPAWREFVVDTLIVPLLRAAAAPKEHGDKLADLALAVEVIAYEVYVKGVEREDHYRDAMQKLMPSMKLIGLKYRDTQSRPVNDSGRLRIGFYLPSTSMMAHTEAMFTMIGGLGVEKPFDPIVFAFGRPDQTMAAVSKKVGAEIVFLGSDTRRTALECMIELRDQARSHQIDVMVYVSNLVGSAFAVGCGVARRNVWWSMKYHDIGMTFFDGYITTESNVHDWIDRGPIRWHCAHPSLPMIFNEARAKQAATWRTRMGCDEGVKLIGCLGRSEKLTDPEYLALVVDLLKQDRLAHFIFTGRYLPQDVAKVFHDGGVSDRAHFIGWVDISIYAGVPDLIVDSFPFASGFTSFGAMQASVPVIGLLTAETKQSSAIGQAWQFSEPPSPRVDEIGAVFTGPAGERLQPWAITVEEMAEVATNWLANADLRRLAGLRQQQFVRSFMSDSMTYGSTFTRAMQRAIGVA